MTGTTHAGSELTAEEAASTIAQARSYEESLGNRSSRICAMLSSLARIEAWFSPVDDWFSIIADRLSSRHRWFPPTHP